MKSLLKSWKTRIVLVLAVIGPGFITANVDNDAAGIFTYSQAGAQFGYTLLWTMIPITIALIVVQEMAARLGAVTGKGLSDLIREEFGFRLTFIVMVTLVITNFGNVIGTTSSVPAAQPVGATVLDYDDALANPAYSRGVFTLAPGSYSISGSLLQSVFGDEGATSGGLRLSVTAVPEPANAALMFAGAAALALLARRRKPGRSADAI